MMAAHGERTCGSRGPVLLVLAVLASLASGMREGRAWAQGAGDVARGLSRAQAGVALRASSNHPDAASNDDSLHPIGGETVVLADLRGPGEITHLWITIADNEYGWPRLLRLRIYYDGSPVPSVDTPLGDFFAVGHGQERSLHSQLVRVSSDGRSRNSYWVMPFRRSCRVTLTNEGRRRVQSIYYYVDWRRLPVPADALYFHARYRQALPSSGGAPYEVLSVRGRGHYAGTVLSALQAQAGWFGEGDERFFVDGERAASIEGTGTEDYFGEAWGLHQSDGLYSGVPLVQGGGLGARMTAYRWHVPDPVPFQRALRFVFEHQGWTYQPDGKVESAFGPRTDLLSSVAFWYQQGIAQDQPELPYGAARLPHGNAQQIEVEDALASTSSERGRVQLVKELFWGKDVLDFNGDGPGARFTVPFDVKEDGDHEVIAHLALGPDYGIYRVLLDGKRPAARQLELEPDTDTVLAGHFDGYAGEVFVGEDYLIGWPYLTRGRHTLTFVCQGRNARSLGHRLGVDSIVLARTGAAAWAAARSIAPPRLPGLDLASLTQASRSNDPLVRGLALLALRDLGGRAVSALPALVARLGDEDVAVRIAAGNALAALGNEATPALAPLTTACARPNEVVQVLRACATALGSMGPAAAPAVPTLRALMALPRVRWAADLALRRIGASPQP